MPAAPYLREQPLPDVRTAGAEDQLDYLIQLIFEMKQLAGQRYPTLEQHLATAHAEALRLQGVG
jgi:hypothetical protein